MAERRVFFSFHFGNDAWRAAQVRNCQQFTGYNVTGFTDAASWESVKKYGDDSIKRWIKNQMEGTSVTVVLIGSETYSRKWVIYEIIESIKEGKGLLGLYIHDLLDQNLKPSRQGPNPLDFVTFKDGTKASQKYSSYLYSNNGIYNLGNWIDEAAKKAGR